MSAFFMHIHRKAPLEAKILDSISSKLVHFSHVTTEAFADDRVQLVYAVNKNDRMHVFRARENRLIFFLQGNIYESAKGIEKIDETSATHSLEAQIVDRYLEKGIPSCVGLNGMYNLFVWDNEKGLLEIAGDRLGIFQVFFASLGDRGFILTSDIMTLKSIPGYAPRINERGIFDILFMGVAYENRTVLEGVERLLSNACYRIEDNELVEVDKFRLPFSKERWGSITPKLLDELEHYYVQAVKRQLKFEDKILFLQSGGKDSRVFSSFLKKAQITPHCVTGGASHHAEAYLARNVSRQLGFPWQRIPISQDFNLSYANAYSEIDSFSGRLFALWQMEIAEKAGSGWDCATATFLGDPVFGSTIRKGKLENANDPRSAFENYLNYWRAGFFSETELEGLFPRRGKEWISEYKKEGFELFESLSDEPYQMIASYAFRFNDRFKVGSAIRTLDAIIPVKLPCIDNDLMDFAFSLPPSLLYDRYLLDLYLTQRAPRLAGIPLDTNSSSYSSLVRALKSEIKFRLWHNLVRGFKFPLLRTLNPISATTQFYVTVFSMRDRGFRELCGTSRHYLSTLEGILDVSKARELFDEKIPEGINHIMRGDRKRALLTAVLAGGAFNS